MASGGLQRPSKARIFFWLKWFLLTPVSIPDGPWWCPAPPRTLQRPRGHQRPAEAEIFFGSNGSFWPQHWSLVVPDGLWPPQDPPAASRPSKVGQDHFFWRRDHYTHAIYNVPLEPERAAEAREARRSCEFLKLSLLFFVYLFIWQWKNCHLKNNVQLDLFQVTGSIKKSQGKTLFSK